MDADITPWFSRQSRSKSKAFADLRAAMCPLGRDSLVVIDDGEGLVVIGDGERFVVIGDGERIDAGVAESK